METQSSKFPVNTEESTILYQWDTFGLNDQTNGFLAEGSWTVCILSSFP